MLVFEKRYELLDYAEKKGFTEIYDLLDKVENKEDCIACTDGKKIYVDIKEFNKLSVEDQFFILSHELLHIVYKHSEFPKEKYRDHELLNICQDVVINEYLLKKLRYRPSNGVFFEDLNNILLHNGVTTGLASYSGTLTTAELYYYLYRYIGNDKFDDLIKELSKENDQIEEDEKGDTSNVITNEIITDIRKTLKITNKILCRENRSIQESDIEDTNPEAGAGSGELTALSKNYKIISKKEIIKYVERFIGNNAVIEGRKSTYTRPSRRIQSRDLIIKGYKRKKDIKEIAVYLDTSGSMDPSFVNNMYHTLKALYRTTKFKMYQFDHYVNKVSFESERMITSGGTNINYVLNHIKENKHDVAIMITDCQDRFSLKGFKSDLMVYTNELSFISDNPKVKVTYFE